MLLHEVELRDSSSKKKSVIIDVFLMSFQTWITFFLLRNTEDDILKRVHFKKCVLQWKSVRSSVVLTFIQLIEFHYMNKNS